MVCTWRRKWPWLWKCLDSAAVFHAAQKRSAGLLSCGGHLPPTPDVCKPSLSIANSPVGVPCKGYLVTEKCCCPWKEGGFAWRPGVRCARALYHAAVLLFDPLQSPGAVLELLHPRRAAAYQR